MPSPINLPPRWATPTIGGTLRYFLGADKVWLQFVPTVLGVTWFCFYWLKERLTWNWPEQMPILVAVSVLTTSYGWTLIMSSCSWLSCRWPRAYCKRPELGWASGHGPVPGH